MIYIVTYDLRTEKDSSSYLDLIKRIKSEGTWACLGGSSYLVKSDKSPVELRDFYKEALDNDDMLYVGKVCAPAAWTGYSSEVSNWIKEKL